MSNTVAATTAQATLAPKKAVSRLPTRDETIIRQNALTQANAYAGHHTLEATVDDIKRYAESFEAWVNREVKTDVREK